MMDLIERLREIWSALRSQVSRGKLVQSAYDPGKQRTLLQGEGLEGETHQGIELLLPYGMSAIPVGRTADYLLLQVQATRDHKVAIGADDPALRIPDLAAGELGLRNGRGSQVVLRGNRIEITAPLDDVVVTASAGNVSVTAALGNIAFTTPGTFSVAAAEIALAGALTNNGVNVGGAHEHSGTQPGSGTSGPPV